MRNFFLFFCVLMCIGIFSCRKDFTTIPNYGQLEFSKDTVYLDTVFTNIGSATYNLKVYNRGSVDITIPRIALENGTSSNYRLNVDGIPGKEFENIDVLGKDSIFIFIETTIDINTINNPLYTDKILFDTGSNQQDVDLVTLVKDANFIYPGRDPISMKIDSLRLDGQPTTIKGRFLSDSELIFTSAKPTVIYGYAAVPNTKTLTIEAGSTIYFHDDSGLIIDKGATLKVNGTLNEPVIFEGDRLENSFGRIPGQWGTIWMRAGSLENEINYAEIKNGVIGVLIDSLGSNNAPTLSLKNTKIFNHTNYGILARQAEIIGENVVLGNAGEGSAALTSGGDYNFSHSTFANFWANGIRSLPAVLVNNFFISTDNSGNEVVTTRNLTNANFTNCIVTGNNNIEFVFDRVDGSTFQFNVANTMIQFNDFNGSFDDVSEMDFTNPTFYQNIIINGNANFRNTAFNDFIIGTGSDAINKGSQSAAALIPFDILGVDRTTNPDLGAYQHIDF